MNSKKEQELSEKFDRHKPKFIRLLGGTVSKVSFNPTSCMYEFDISADYCHSVDIVQGGFVTAMLDAAMSHAAYAIDEAIFSVSTIEISTRFHTATRAGILIATGLVRSTGYKLAFLEGQLHNEAGALTATSQSTVKLSRKK